MSYVQSANRLNPAAIIGAIGMPGAFAVLLVTGLTITGAIAAPDEGFTAWQIPVDPPKPPPPPPPTPATETPQKPQAKQSVPTFVPAPPKDFSFNAGPSRPIETLPGFTGGAVGPVELPGNLGKVAPKSDLFDPVGASPRGAPGKWVTDSDYRSNWIRKGYSGRTSFALAIDASGRVSNCTITASSGHEELDLATCKLVERRARFDPAKDAKGNPVAGTYRNTVNWRLPE